MRSVYREVAFMPGWHGRAATDQSRMRTYRQRSGPAFCVRIGHMVPDVFGTIFLEKDIAACTVSNGSCATTPSEPAQSTDNHQKIKVPDRSLRQRALESGRGKRSETEMGCRLNLDLDCGRMALRCSRHRSVFAACCGLFNERENDVPDGHHRPDQGDLAQGRTGLVAALFRPGQPIYQSAVPATNGRGWDHMHNEPFRQCL